MLHSCHNRCLIYLCSNMVPEMKFSAPCRMYGGLSPKTTGWNEMKLVKGIAIGAVALALAACDQQGGFGGAGTKQTIGTVGGAVAGGLAGSGRSAAARAGSGRRAPACCSARWSAARSAAALDRADQRCHGPERILQCAFNTGRSSQTVQWRNPDSGNYGYVNPRSVPISRIPVTCREYNADRSISAVVAEQAYGTACRQPDGSWQIQN